MKRILLLLAAATLAIPLYTAPKTAMAGEVTAAPAQEQARYRVYRGRAYRPAYRHSHRRYYRQYSTVYQPHYSYSYYYYNPPMVYAPPAVVVQPAPVVVPQPVVMAQPVAATAQPTPVVYEAPEEVVIEEEGRPSVALVARFAGMNQSDTDISFDTISGMGLLGVGAGLRFDIDRHWMIELGADVMGREDEFGIAQWSIPLTVSIMAHIFPDSIIDPYALAGLGAVINQYDDPGYYEIESYTQFEGHLGFGADINLGRRFFLNTDMRFLFLQARPDREYSTSVAGLDDGGVTIRDDAAAGSSVDISAEYEEPDAVTTAFQFNLGAGWRF